MLENGVIPIPPARNTAGLAEFLCSVKEPIAESIFTTVPSGTFVNERLNAVSRIRVANISWSSNGALAMEKVRTFPLESVSGGFNNVRSEDCPGLKSNPAGFSKWKAMVPSATSTLFNSLDAYADTEISSAGMMRFTTGIRPSAIGQTTRAGLLSSRARQVALKAVCLCGAKDLQELCSHALRRSHSGRKRTR